MITKKIRHPPETEDAAPKTPPSGANGTGRRGFVHDAPHVSLLRADGYSFEASGLGTA